MAIELLKAGFTVLVFFAIGWPIAGLIIKNKGGASGTCGGIYYCRKSGADDNCLARPP